MLFWAQEYSLARVYMVRLQDQPHIFALPARDNESAFEALENYKQSIQSDTDLNTEQEAREVQRMQIREVVTVHLDRQPSLLVLANRFYDQTPTKKSGAMLRVDRVAESLRGKTQMVIWPIAATARFTKMEQEQMQSEIIEKFDGVLALGGADIDPAVYAEPNNGARATNPRRDQLEIEFVQRWLQHSNKLVLGICRGHQLIATALGFKLRQHIEGHGDGEWLQHELHFTNLRYNRLRDLFAGQTISVKSYHHQSVEQRTNSIRSNNKKTNSVQITAIAADGTIEAIESIDGNIFSFQFHPEFMQDRAGRKIFQLINSALYNRFIERRKSPRSCNFLF